MKVAFVVMDFPVNSETFALRDITSLVDEDVKIDVFTLRGSARERVFDGVNINPSLKTDGFAKSIKRLIRNIRWFFYILRNEKKNSEKLKLIYFITRCSRIVSAVNLRKYDVVHLYWGHYPSLVGLMLSRQTVSPILSLFLGAYDLEKKLEVSKILSAKADVRWTHAHGNISKLMLAQFPCSEEFIVNYRGLNIKSLHEQHIQKVSRKYDFITVSRLVDGKGIMQALQAANALKQEGINFMYAIVGDGPLKDQCISYIQEHALDQCVDFYGYLPVDQVFSLMSNSRYFILLSEKIGECLPNVIKEALMYECYILSGQSACIEELIPDERVGLIVQCTDHDGIVKLLKDFLNNKTVQDIKYQKDILKEKFDIKKSAKKYINEWRKEYEK